MLYVILLKQFKQWNFEKLQITLLAKFLHKNYRFSKEALHF